MTSIPIHNIYYLLSYAWNKLEAKGKLKVSIDGSTTLQDLFAQIIISGSTILLKRGLSKCYFTHLGEVSGIKGKIDLDRTLKSAIHLKQRTYCNYDIYSPDTLANQIIFTTLRRLVLTEGVDKNLKYEIKQIMRFFPPELQAINLDRHHFTLVSKGKKNSLYDFLLDVCRLAFENSLPSEKPGNWIFNDFSRDERQMNALFEAFIRRFYQVKLRHQFSVGSKVIKWKFHGSQVDMEYLPQMKTDIILENENEKIIIDAKFYNETMTINFGKERIHSSNLYQLFAYLVNQEDGTDINLNAKGILLYPLVQQEYNLQYIYNTHSIAIRTVNLANDWKKIEQRLLEIITIESN